MYNKMLGRFLDFMGDVLYLALMIFPFLSVFLNPWFFYKEDWNENAAGISLMIFGLPPVLAASAYPFTEHYIVQIITISMVVSFIINFFGVFIPAVEGFIKGRLDLREPHSHKG